MTSHSWIDNLSRKQSNTFYKRIICSNESLILLTALIGAGLCSAACLLGTWFRVQLHWVAPWTNILYHSHKSTKILCVDFVDGIGKNPPHLYVLPCISAKRGGLRNTSETSNSPTTSWSRIISTLPVIRHHNRLFWQCPDYHLLRERWLFFLFAILH